MSSLLTAIIAIAGLCGPRVQSSDPNETSRDRAKACQVQMLKCVKAKQTPIDESLATCMQEIK